MFSCLTAAYEKALLVTKRLSWNIKQAERLVSEICNVRSGQVSRFRESAFWHGFDR